MLTAYMSHEAGLVFGLEFCLSSLLYLVDILLMLIIHSTNKLNSIRLIVKIICHAIHLPCSTHESCLENFQKGAAGRLYATFVPLDFDVT